MAVVVCKACGARSVVRSQFEVEGECPECGEEELVQEDATPQALAQATLAWLDDVPRSASLSTRFTELHHLLKRDTARCATDAIAKILEA